MPTKNTNQPLRQPAVDSRSLKNKKIPFYIMAVAFIAFGMGFIHVYHVSTLHENSKHFSHLSTLEREMTFYTEMALYYSYYKELVEAPSYLGGLLQIMHDNKTEYPLEINTLQRFNVYPEIVGALMYRGFMFVAEKLNITTKHCWQIDRGSGLQVVLSCEGLGDPVYFYLEIVWLCAGLTMAVIFLFGHLLSGSIIGGTLAVLCFFYNHHECTRVMWAPPLRESFAYPFCILQMLAVCKCLHSGHYGYNESLVRKILLIWIPTWLVLVLWQFTQFVLTTQLLAIFFLHVLGVIKMDTFRPIIYGYMFAVCHAAFSLFVNKFLLFSLLTTTLIIIMILTMGLSPLLKHLPFVVRATVFGIVTPILAFLIKTQMNYISGFKDDMHILNILKAKLLGYKDFHTLLYTCAAEFDFLPWNYVTECSKTLLLPSALLAILLVVVRWFQVLTKKDRKETASFAINLKLMDPVIAYTFLQLIAFGIMAALIMRLKLFLTPHLCLMVSLLASPKYNPCRSQEVRFAAIFLLIGGMSVTGVRNLENQRDIIGEYSNIPMEQLLNWISAHTTPKAVFAGPMPVMACVLLSTRRPVVNHPHYEDANLRARTKNVYSVFSRRSPQEVYITLSQMQVDYIILSAQWCFEDNTSGCGIIDSWDIEEPKNLHQPPVCPTLFHGNPSPFIKVFANEMYVVLQIHPQSQYVELQSPKLLSQ